jgi:Pseudouridylate synthases, 23S RNA-specific
MASGWITFYPRNWKVFQKGAFTKWFAQARCELTKDAAKPDARVKSGDVVRIPPVHLDPAAPTVAHRGIQMRLSDALLYKDKDVLVLNKLPGLAVHGGSGLSTGLNW